MTYLTSTLGALALSALSALTFVACTGSGGAPTPEEQIANFCEDTVAPTCEAFFNCCIDPVGLPFNDVNECKTILADSCASSMKDAVLPQIEAGKMALDEDRLAACVSRLDAMSAGGKACTEPALFVSTVDCLAAFQGTIAPGEPCDESPFPVDLVKFLPCKDGICQNGKCQAFLATGDACSPANKDTSVAPLCNFAKHEWCIGDTKSGHCGPRAKVGEQCGDPGNDDTLACDSISCDKIGICAAPTAKQLCAQAR